MKRTALLLAVLLVQPLAAQQAKPAGLQVEGNPKVADVVNAVSTEHMQRWLTKLVGFGTRHTLSDTVSSTRGIGAARRYILQEFQQLSKACGGCLEVYYDPHMVSAPRTNNEPVNVVNVVAKLKGRTDPNRVIVMMGHYDSCQCNIRGGDPEGDAPGANDDGSGTVEIMELARVFSQKFPQGLDATVMFVTVAGEEQGLLGAAGLAEKLFADTNLRVQAATTNDVAGNIHDPKGRADSVTMRVFAPEPDDGASRNLARFVKAVGEAYQPNFEVRVIERLDRMGRGGDHRPFWDRGVAAVRFSESFEDHRHQHYPEDKLEFVSFPYMQKIARVNAATAAHLGLAPAAPDSLRMRRNTQVSGHDFILSWKAPENAPDLAGYEITLRSTTSAYVDRVIPVGNVTTYTLENTQADDLWVGIRSVDKDGFRSPVASFHSAESLPAFMTRRQGQ